MQTIDRVQNAMGDACDYAVPEGDQPALHRLARAARSLGHPWIVTEDGLPLLVVISPEVYRDLLALHGPMGTADSRMAAS